MRTGPKPQGKAMYVASEDDRSWLLSVQRALYTRSQQVPEYVFRKLWGFVTDPRNLRVALARVCRNRGRRTAGVDGVTVRKVLAHGSEPFVASLRKELRTRTFRPSPARRVLIPKAGNPGKFRPLGIPTVRDRVVQAAMKNIMEPIFEAGFYPVSYGFRPSRSVHGAIAHLKAAMLPRRRKGRAKTGAPPLPYQWAIEGDIKGCFDNISHHALMNRVRKRIGDPRLTRLVLAFLKAGIMSESQFLRSDSGTPQGGVLSPLLANIALGVIEERYERYVWPRRAIQSPRQGRAVKALNRPEDIALRASRNRANDKRRGRVIFLPIRYADDFIILISVPDEGPQDPRRVAEEEKAALASHLRAELGLELSEEKTLVTPVTDVMRFLGHHLRVRPHPGSGTMVSHAVVPKDRSKELRRKIKGIFSRKTLGQTLESRLELLNPVLRGWGNFYKHAWGAKKVFRFADHYVWWTIYRWLHKKHPNTPTRQLYKQYGYREPRRRSMRFRDGNAVVYRIVRLKVRPFRFAWQKTPSFAQNIYGEPGA